MMDSSEFSEISETDTEKKPHKCNMDGCHSKFSKLGKLIIHLRKHAGERPFQCDVADCKKSYTNNSHLIRHKKSFHEKVNEQAICEHKDCGKTFLNKWTLKRHNKRKHNPDREYPFRCFDCNQGFFKKRQLIQHQFVHTGQEPFKCDKCEMRFLTHRDCNKHKKNHTTYYCECGEKFERWTLLLRHRKQCRIEKIKCNICGKEFAGKQNLKQHLKTHIVRTKQFICHYENCSRSYFEKKNLVFHIKAFHEKKDDNNKIPCTFEHCSAILKTKNILKQHIRIKHSDVPKPKIKRRARHDKGIPKKPMASVLSGVSLSIDKNKSLIMNGVQLLQEKIDVEESETSESLSDTNITYSPVVKNETVTTNLLKNVKQPNLDTDETLEICEENDLISKCKIKVGKEFIDNACICNKKLNIQISDKKLEDNRLLNNLFLQELPESSECVNKINMTDEDILLQECDATLKVLEKMGETLKNDNMK